MKNVRCATAKTLGHNCSSYAMFKWDIVYEATIKNIT